MHQQQLLHDVMPNKKIKVYFHGLYNVVMCLLVICIENYFLNFKIYF